MRRRLTAYEERRARTLWDQGWKLGEIAKELGCSVYDLSRLLISGTIDEVLEAKEAR